MNAYGCTVILFVLRILAPFVILILVGEWSRRHPMRSGRM